MDEIYELVVIGGSAQGLSTAMIAQRIGATPVKILEETSVVAYPELVGIEKLDIAFGVEISSITLDGDILEIATTNKTYHCKTIVVAKNSPEAQSIIPDTISVSSLVHGAPIEEITAGQDILVVGDNDRAAVLASRYITQGARSVVLAAKGMNPDLLSWASHDEIAKLEYERLLTVFYRSAPKTIDEYESGALVNFGDSRTPELEFDQVIYAPAQALVAPEKLGIQAEALYSGRIFYVRDPRLSSDLPSGTSREVITELSQYYSQLDNNKLEQINAQPRNYRGAQKELRQEHYNATVTYFEKAHSDLWVIRIKPDRGDISHLPGQYANLGLGYWEERVDDAMDKGIEDKWAKMIYRSYSISNRIWNDKGYLASETQDDELEFYIVLVPPTAEKIPELTPRLALLKQGDRIYLGPKVTGRYTLKSVQDPGATILFFATGTGEAPHNSMVVELLRNGHRGKIISAVSVRESKDLGYLKQNRKLEENYPQYTYIPMPTREPDIVKRYNQDLITSGEIEDIIGGAINPDNTHAFICGNPAMIGAPEKIDGVEVFPETVGVVQLLVEKGMKIDERRSPGNIHYENFWKP